MTATAPPTILAVIQIGAKIVVISPHVRRVVNSDGTLSMILSEQSDLRVANDHIITPLMKIPAPIMCDLQCISWQHKKRR
jgi:hypothetical protein